MSNHYIFPSLVCKCALFFNWMSVQRTKYTVSFLVSRAWKLSQESQTDAVFVCSKAAMLRDVIKGMPVLFRCIHLSEDS